MKFEQLDDNNHESVNVGQKAYFDTDRAPCIKTATITAVDVCAGTVDVILDDAVTEYFDLEFFYHCQDSLTGSGGGGIMSAAIDDEVLLFEQKNASGTTERRVIGYQDKPHYCEKWILEIVIGTELALSNRKVILWDVWERNLAGVRVGNEVIDTWPQPYAVLNAWRSSGDVTEESNVTTEYEGLSYQPRSEDDGDQWYCVPGSPITGDDPDIFGNSWLPDWEIDTINSSNLCDMPDTWCDESGEIGDVCDFLCDLSATVCHYPLSAHVSDDPVSVDEFYGYADPNSTPGNVIPSESNMVDVVNTRLIKEWECKYGLPVYDPQYYRELLTVDHTSQTSMYSRNAWGLYLECFGRNIYGNGHLLSSLSGLGVCLYANITYDDDLCDETANMDNVQARTPFISALCDISYSGENRYKELDRWEDYGTYEYWFYMVKESADRIFDHEVTLTSGLNFNGTWEDYGFESYSFSDTGTSLNVKLTHNIFGEIYNNTSTISLFKDVSPLGGPREHEVRANSRTGKYSSYHLEYTDFTCPFRFCVANIGYRNIEIYQHFDHSPGGEEPYSFSELRITRKPMKCACFFGMNDQRYTGPTEYARQTALEALVAETAEEMTEQLIGTHSFSGEMGDYYSTYHDDCVIGASLKLYKVAKPSA